MSRKIIGVTVGTTLNPKRIIEYIKNNDAAADGSTSVLGVAKLGVMRLGSTGKGTGDTSKAVGIKSIEQTATSTEDGGVNEITVTLTNSETFIFHIKNGSKGGKGDKGDTPQKGIDYFTEADIQEIVTAVLNALPDGDGVSY